MPRVIIKEDAAQGLERCRRFLETEQGVDRPFDDLPEFREFIIPF